MSWRDFLPKPPVLDSPEGPLVRVEKRSMVKAMGKPAVIYETLTCGHVILRTGEEPSRLDLPAFPCLLCRDKIAIPVHGTLQERWDQVAAEVKAR